MSHIEAAYSSAETRLGGLGFAEFCKAVERCQVHPVTVDGAAAGAIIVDGPEVHACVMPWAHGRWIGRRELAVLNQVIRAHGYAKTTATTDEGRRFVERLGFKRTGQEYRKEVPYGH